MGNYFTECYVHHVISDRTLNPIEPKVGTDHDEYHLIHLVKLKRLGTELVHVLPLLWIGGVTPFTLQTLF